MKRTTSIITFLAVLFVIPLLGRPEAMWSWPVLLAAAVVIILLATQPVMDLGEAKRDKTTDRGTMLLIAGVSVCGLIISLIHWAYFKDAPQAVTTVALIEVLLMLFGLAFRIWAIQTLKSAFSATVQIKKGQPLITTGPYRWFRHPSYTGAWLLMVGVALLFQSWPGLLIMGPGMLWVYSQRIATEERTLQAAFGDEYAEMKKRTWMMIPGW